jgi:hypothetical protein
MKPKGEWTSMRRKDLGLLLVIGFLFSALTFNFGIYWGIKWGLHQASVSLPAAPFPNSERPNSTIEALSPEAGASGENDWHTKKEIPTEITESFVKSKQSALIETQLRTKDRPSVGNSIADAETYFREKKLNWGEVPKELEKLDRSIASESTKPSLAEMKGEVAGLFERSPASVKSFSPTPGQMTVQVASYATEEEAIARVKLLIASGISEAYYSKTKVSGENWFQVSVGSYRDAKWAKKMGERMIRRNIASEFFVRKVSDN